MENVVVSVGGSVAVWQDDIPIIPPKVRKIELAIAVHMICRFILSIFVF